MNLVHPSFPSLVAPPSRRILWVLLPLLTLLLSLCPEPAHAASVFNGFPLVDDVLCGFFAYSRTKLAPMIAGVVLVFSVVGHWLGSGKMWSTMLYVGLGLGIVLGTGSALASYTGVAASCIAS